ncbi:MAG TPA: hypothetical protein VNS55_02720 [Nocardioides sp.]|nr:hypothetical protein [Nocardioides sp.]
MKLTHLAAAAAAAAITLVAAPAHAQDNDLMNPNAPDTCYQYGREVPSGTVATTFPGSPTTPDGHTPGAPPIVKGDGTYATSIYVCIDGRWVWAGAARRAGVVNPSDVGGPGAGPLTLATTP